MTERGPVDELAQEIRRVDGSHSLGAGALAEALMPFIGRWTAAAFRQGYVDGEFDTQSRVDAYGCDCEGSA